MTNKKGIFISFESLDGAGKSTHVQLLANKLEQRNIPYILTKEPGGTLVGDKIRQLLLDPNNSNMTNMAELLLYAASRTQLVEQIIKPALNEGKMVICDRYVDSSVAYQGYGLDMGADLIAKINNHAIQGLFPDITFYLKISPEESLRRKIRMTERDGSNLDRIEQRELEFYTKVYEGFESLSMNDDRFITIDATFDKNLNHKTIFKNVIDRYTKQLGLM